MNINLKNINAVLFISGQRGLIILEYLNQKNLNISKVIVGSEKDLDLLNETNKFNGEIIFEKNINNKNFLDQISDLDTDYFILSGFRQILKKDILNIPKKGTINLHGGKLPEYRGGSPLNWQIINGEKYIYITTILTDEGIDTGNILSENSFEIMENDDIATVHEKANNLFPEMVLDSIKMIEGGNQGEKQDEKKASYWHQRNDDDGYINFKDYDAESVVRMTKALTYPYPCAWGVVDKEKVRIIKAKVSDMKLKAKPGEVCVLNDNDFFIICSEGSVQLLKYKFEQDEKRKLNKNDKFD